jgi:hypothetical protein
MPEPSFSQMNGQEAGSALRTLSRRQLVGLGAGDQGVLMTRSGTGHESTNSILMKSSPALFATGRLTRLYGCVAN